MHLLGTDAYRFALATAIANARTNLSIVSAYVTSPGIEWVLDGLSPKVKSFRVLSRWHPADFVSGASDLSAYEHVKEAGGHFFVLPDVHAKLILVDNQYLFVGSANITALGLKLVPGGNREIGVSFRAIPNDISTVDVMFAEAIEVTESLYERFRKHIDLINSTTKKTGDVSWPPDLARELATKPKRLWVAELFWSTHPATVLDPAFESDETTLHDFLLLGFERGMLLDNDSLRDAFFQSRPWTWLLARLSDESSHQLSFGRLSELLDNALLDDPKPYRKDIKQLVANLLGWVQALGQPLATVERRNYSQSVRLIERFPNT